jgi:hypothetical protein
MGADIADQTLKQSLWGELSKVHCKLGSLLFGDGILVKGTAVARAFAR